MVKLNQNCFLFDIDIIALNVADNFFFPFLEISLIGHSKLVFQYFKIASDIKSKLKENNANVLLFSLLTELCKQQMEVLRRE